jgi:simple sugar transport system permease protein
MELIIPVLKSALTIMIPIFFAALGGLFPSLAGTLNIALEGLLLAGAFSSLTVFYFTGNLAVAIFSSIFTAVILSALHSFAVFKLRANLFISGLAINLFSSGLCVVLSDKIFKTKGVITVNGVHDLLKLFVFLGIILLLISWLAIYKTPFGYRLRACDNNSGAQGVNTQSDDARGNNALISLGIKPVIYRTAALLISGFFCGIGGSFLSLNLGVFVPGISAGTGWIALAVIFLGVRKPLRILAAAFVFSLAECFSNYAQGFWSIPSGFILAFPYIITLIVLILISIIPKYKKYT